MHIDDGDEGDPPVTALTRKIMRQVRSKDTKPELIVRRALHKAGYRYRLHNGKLPGRPDIVFPGRKAVVLIHGCFWHRHEGCRLASTPKTRAEFWNDKFDRNIARDRRDALALADMGWTSIVIWECETRGSGTYWARLVNFLNQSVTPGET